MPAPLIIAHRGASFDAPENTLAGFRLAWAQNADGAEGDFHLTRDGRIVCIHDPTTTRTTGIDLLVRESTLDELRALDVGGWKHPQFAGERIATLGQILQLLPPGKLFFIEIKCGPEILPALREIISRSGIHPDQLRIICFNADVIRQASQILPHIKRHWLVEYAIDPLTGGKIPTPRDMLQTLQRIGANGLNSQADSGILTPDFVAQLSALNLETAAWTIDDPILARTLAQSGVEMLTTNRPAWMRAKLHP